MTNLTSSKKLSTILNAYNMGNLNEVDDGFIWRRFVRTHIVTPFSPKFCFWQILILLVTIFNTLYIPMAIAYYDFLEGQDLRFAVVSWIGDAILVLDCVFNAFFFAYEHRGATIKAPDQIWHRYKTGRFVRDLLSVTIWLDVAVVFTGVKFLPFLRIPRMFQMFRVLDCISKLENYLRVTKGIFFPKSFRVLEILVVVFLVTQSISCIWYICAFQDNSWTVRYDLTEASFSYQYVRAFYFSLGTMLVVFCGDIVPVTAIETTTMVLVLIFGITVYAAFVANLATLFTDIDATFMQSHEKYQQMKQYLKFEKMPRSLQDGINAYYHHLIGLKKGMDEQEVFRSLPIFLREEIGFFLVGRHLRPTFAFKECTSEFIQHVCGALEPVFFTQDQYVFREGELGDFMIFISSGRAEFVSKLHEDAGAATITTTATAAITTVITTTTTTTTTTTYHRRHHHHHHHLLLLPSLPLLPPLPPPDFAGEIESGEYFGEGENSG